MGNNSEILKPIALDETLQNVAGALHRQNMILDSMANTGYEQFESYEEIGRVVASGKGSSKFGIGDQIIVPWTNVETGEKFDVPLNVVHHGTVTLKNGEKVPGMYVQWNYCTSDALQFDNYEAFYAAEEELPAGTYHVTMGLNWGSNVVQDKTYQFALTKPVPAGGKLRGFFRAPDTAPSTWTVESYETAYLSSKIETVTVTEGSQGMSLGTFTAAGTNELNSIHRVAYGYNRYGQSAERQYLNSKAGAGNWWTPQNKYDMAPDQLTSLAGHMSGYEDDFLKILSPVKVTTALNTVTDTADGISEDTYDTFFLPSLEEIYCTPQASGVEGTAFEWWKRALELTAPAAYHPSTYDAYKIFAINAKASAQHVRLRSAYRGTGTYTWYVYSGGSVSHYYYAIDAYRRQPACVITGIPQ